MAIASPRWRRAIRRRASTMWSSSSIGKRRGMRPTRIPAHPKPTTTNRGPSTPISKSSSFFLSFLLLKHTHTHQHFVVSDNYWKKVGRPLMYPHSKLSNIRPNSLFTSQKISAISFFFKETKKNCISVSARLCLNTFRLTPIKKENVKLYSVFFFSF